MHCIEIDFMRLLIFEVKNAERKTAYEIILGKILFFLLNVRLISVQINQITQIPISSN